MGNARLDFEKKYVLHINFFILIRQLYIHFTIHSIHQLNGKLLCYFIRVFWYPGRLCNYVKHWAGITSYDFFWHEAMFLVNSWYIDGRVPYNYYFYFFILPWFSFFITFIFFPVNFFKNFIIVLENVFLFKIKNFYLLIITFLLIYFF